MYYNKDKTPGCSCWKKSNVFVSHHEFERPFSWGPCSKIAKESDTKFC